jgi:hypothetical protein
MNNERDKDRDISDSDQGDHGEIEISALESAASYLRASQSASGASHGGRSSFTTSFETLLEWGEASGLIRPEGDFSFFQRKPDAHGNEHEVWFEELHNLWFKATYPNKFGLAWGRSGSATASEYLNRLMLQNEYFADDTELVALVNSGQKLRIVTCQSHIQGEAASAGEIQLWFSGLGFVRIEANDSVAWYLPSENLLVADAHEGNVIRAAKNILFAIDLNIIQPQGEMLKEVLSLVAS